jgi:hypothetical protein
MKGEGSKNSPKSSEANVTFDITTLLPFAHYLWWYQPSDIAQNPLRLVAQMMEIGTHREVQMLVNQIGDEPFRAVLRNPPAGLFSERSWHYWHLRLGMAELDTIPPLPKRKIPE